MKSTPYTGSVALDVVLVVCVLVCVLRFSGILGLTILSDTIAWAIWEGGVGGGEGEGRNLVGCFHLLSAAEKNDVL